MLGLVLGFWGLTLSPFEPMPEAVGGAKAYRGLLEPTPPTFYVPEVKDTEWTTVDSSLMELMLPPGGRCIMAFDTNLGIVRVEVPDWPLTALAQQAVDAAPSWLRDELADNLAHLPPAYQDTYALYILDCPDPRYLD